MVYPRRWKALLGLAVLALAGCAGPGATQPSAAEEAASQIGETGSTAIRDLEDVSIFNTVTPMVGFGAWAQECEPSDDPFSSCV